MKTIVAVFFSVVVLAGCGKKEKKEEEVDNAATQYAESLREDVVKARAAAEKADAAIAAEAARMKEAQNLAGQ